uniref:hypothetical protein n=1 Tax=Staphylococcus epidermidis TaxID=1282 RepID=UPI002738EFBA
MLPAAVGERSPVVSEDLDIPAGPNPGAVQQGLFVANGIRRQNGLPELTLDPVLAAVAHRPKEGKGRSGQPKNAACLHLRQSAALNQIYMILFLLYFYEAKLISTRTTKKTGTRKDSALWRLVPNILP